MKKYHLEISQNKWEYTGLVYIECEVLERDITKNNIVYADGVKIEFDEEIGYIKTL